MTQGDDQQQSQSQQSQQQSTEQRLAQALADIRKVQNMVELNYPAQGNAISMLREAGDLVWDEIQSSRQQQEQQ